MVERSQDEERLRTLDKVRAQDAEGNQVGVNSSGAQQVRSW
jgi:hypothetical protein